MRAPVVLVCGQGNADAIADVLAQESGTVVVRHRFDGQGRGAERGHVVGQRNGLALEIANGCVAGTVRNDLLVLLRRLHRRSDIRKIAVVLMPWLEPEPVCWAIDNWLNQAVGDDELDDGRTVAQVVVGQADARPGRSSHPHEPLLTGQPSLDPDGDVGLGVVLCPPPVSPAATARRAGYSPRRRGAHPRPGVAGESVRRRDVDRVGRRRPAVQLCRKMACGNGSQATCIRRSATPRARRRDWDNRLGDRHVSISVLVCGAEPEDIVDGLRRALLTDDELARPNEWARYADPFGDWHEDPCDDSPERATDIAGPNAREGEDR